MIQRARYLRRLPSLSSVPSGTSGREYSRSPKSRKTSRIAEEELLLGLLEYSLPEVPEGTLDKDGKRRK